MLAGAWPALAETVRIATYDANLSRKGPGLLARDIAAGKDAQATAVVKVLIASAPDVVLLSEFDWDDGHVALRALQNALHKAGRPYEYAYAPAPNTGMPTGLDLDGDGQLDGPRDAQGYGRFSGNRGMALLSRLPLDLGQARDMSAMLWRDLPGNQMDQAALPAGAHEVLRLSTTGHWDIPVTLPDGRVLHLLAYSATPPAFAPLAANIARNHDETAFWLHYLDGHLPWPAPQQPFVILGVSNSDVADGGGQTDAMNALLTDRRLQDTRPASAGGAAANAGGAGDPALDTADWAENPNVKDNLRVDYVLPSVDLTVTASGVFWPAPGDPMAEVAAGASAHRLVWVDIKLP